MRRRDESKISRPMLNFKLKKEFSKEERGGYGGKL